MEHELEKRLMVALDDQHSGPEWDDVMHRTARVAPTPGRPSFWKAFQKRGPRLLVPALVVAVLAIAGAAAAGGRLWSGSSTAVDTSQATSLVEYTLTTGVGVWKPGDRIALWRLPQPDGSTCVQTALASPKPTTASDLGAGSCGMSHVVPTGKPMSINLEASLSGGGYNRLITGTVSSGSDIARMEIRSDAGTLPLAYSHGWFLGQLPPSSSWNLPQPGQYVVVGYDSQGKAVERRDVRQALTNSAP